MATTPFEIDHGRVRIGDAVLVYLERAVAPRDPLPAGVVPRSHGVAPTFVSAAGAVVAPVAAGEAIWLGFQAVDRHRPVTVRVRLEGAVPLDAVTGAAWREGISDAPRRNHLVCPPDSWLVGVRCAEGRRPFGTTPGETRAGVVEELTVIAWVPKPVAIAVQLVRPEQFTRLSGVVPAPIDPRDAYAGRRLP